MVLVPAYSLLKQEQLQLAQLGFVISGKTSSSVPMFGNRYFLAMGTRGSKTGKHRAQCLGTSSS